MRKESGPVIDIKHQKTFYAHLGIIAKRAGVKWKQNALRHSYGSYRLQVAQNLTAVSWEMGNSSGVIQKHYFSLVLPKDAQAYFEIFPKEPAELAVAA